MIAQFALRLLCGMSLMWSIMPRDQVTLGFFRIQMLVALGLSVLVALTFNSAAGGGAEAIWGQPAALGIGVLLAVTAFVGSVVWTLGRRRAGAGCVYTIAFVSVGLLLTVRTSSANSLLTPIGLLGAASELTSGMLVGGTVTAMLLGHWYLTAPTMSIEPLSRLTGYLHVATWIRLLLSGVALWLAWDQISAPEQWTWLSLRWLAGIFGLLAVIFLVGRILRYRNTQSATGVLFAGVILTFIGELSASLLERELSIPM
jgi:hypothetical protein